MALRFLLEGAVGERNLYITLSETKAELLNGAASHGWSLGPNIEVFELQPAERVLDPDQQQSLLYSSELELGETFKLHLETVEPFNLDELCSTVCRRFASSPKAHFVIAVSSGA